MPLSQRRLLFILILSSLVVVAATALLRPQVVTPIVTPLKASGIYELGEPAGWRVTLPGGAPSPGICVWKIRQNNANVIATGELDLSKGPRNVEVTLNDPAMLYMELSIPGVKEPKTYGAAVAPTRLKPVVERPHDFDAFWRRKIAELHAVPANPVITSVPVDVPGVDYGTIKMDHVNGTHVYGQIAKPSKPGKYPALLILLWASPPYPVDKSWVLGYAQQGWLTLNIEPHDVLPTEPPDYYRNLPNSLKNYNMINVDDRETNYFVEMYLRDFRAVDYLAQHPEWDGKTLVVMGTSMGGQQSFAVCGLHPAVTHMIVHVPAGCDLNAALHGRSEGYPFLPTSDAKAMEVARYIDAINFAPNIKARSLVSMGFLDTAAPPAGIWTAFNLIKGPKEAAPMPEAPHNNLATAEQQKPYTEREHAWLSALVKGEAIPPPK